MLVLNNSYYTFIETPIGILKITADKKSITGIIFDPENTEGGKSNEIIELCKKELQEYFSGERKSFTVSVNQKGSRFQKKVWNELQKIPYGKTVSYGYIAERVGGKNFSRAVGSANNKNHIPIVVPCHRVVGSNGSLTGYAGGLWRKKWLIMLEEGKR
jgi:methylated-DNA-[protein]-cysteine S-methyltransferase